MNTRITSLLAYDQYFAFIPPHGREITAGSYVDIYGDIYSVLMVDYPKRGKRWVDALEAAIDRGDITVELMAGDMSTYEDCFSVLPQTIATIVGDGATVTVTTTADHEYESGQRVGISGTSVGGWDGNFYVITVTGTDTFTFTDATASSAIVGTAAPAAVWDTATPVTMNEAVCRLAVSLSAHLGIAIP